MISPIPAMALAHRGFEVSWEENQGTPIHVPLKAERRLWGRPMVVYAVEFFFGTFAEQWNEADLEANLLVQDGDKVRTKRLARVCPHKHGGDNLGPPNAHGDNKSIQTGGLYYNASKRFAVGPNGVGVLVPEGSVLQVVYSMAESGRGLHVGLVAYAYDPQQVGQ